MIKGKNYNIIYIGVLIIIGIIIALCYLLFSKQGDVLEIRIDGELNKSFNLSIDSEYLIESDYGTNELIIENNEAYFKEASCPDKLCVNMGKISKDKQTIICLPNHVVVEIKTNKDGGVDIITGK